MCSYSLEGSMEIVSFNNKHKFGAILKKNLLDRPLKCQLKRFTQCCHLLDLLEFFVISFDFLFTPETFCSILPNLLRNKRYQYNPSGLVHIPRSLCFVSNSCLLVFITAKEMRKGRKYSGKSWQTLLIQPSRG